MKHNNGTFVAVKFDDDFCEALHKYTVDNGVPNPLSPHEYHSTIAYSRTPLENVRSNREIDWTGKPISFDVFLNRSGGKINNCLVLKIDSSNMSARHSYLKEYSNLTHDFPSYIPHITLSYDIGDFDISKLSDIHAAIPSIKMIREYSEELKDDRS